MQGLTTIKKYARVKTV